MPLPQKENIPERFVVESPRQVKTDPYNPLRKGRPHGKRPTSRSMPCPVCGHSHTQSADYFLSLRSPNNWYVYRRRRCGHCSLRFTTHEQIAVPNVTVVKRDGRREPFDVAKLTGSIKLALGNRIVSDERILRIAAAIKVTLSGGSSHVRLEVSVTSTRVGALCMASLKELDELAYLRYASVFLRFTHRSAFERLLLSLDQDQPPA